MHFIAIAFRPTRALLFVMGLLLGYAGLLASSLPAATDDEISRVELLD